MRLDVPVDPADEQLGELVAVLVLHEHVAVAPDPELRQVHHFGVPAGLLELGNERAAALEGRLPAEGLGHISEVIIVAKRLPGQYLRTKKLFPEYVAALESLGEAARKAGPLDARTLHLVQLAAAAAVRSEGAVHSHARRALEDGATPEQLRHALVAVTSTIGFPNVTAALSWLEDVLGRRTKP